MMLRIEFLVFIAFFKLIVLNVLFYHPSNFQYSLFVLCNILKCFDFNPFLNQVLNLYCASNFVINCGNRLRVAALYE